MTVVDPTMLPATLNEENGQFPRTLARRALGTIGSPTAMTAKGQEFATSPVGAGPFMLENWVRDSTLTLVRNPNYWNAPRPYLDKLEIRIAQDHELRYNALRSGDADVIAMVHVPQIASRAEQEGYTTILTALGGGSTIEFNTKRPPFDDVRARRAVYHAFDLPRLIETVYGGNAIVPETLFAPGSPFYDASLAFPKHDKAQAQALVNEYMAATGRPLEFTLRYSAASQQTAELLQANTREIDNLRMNLEPIQPAEIIPTAASGSDEAMTLEIGLVDAEPDLFDKYHTGASRNFPGYSNPEMDAALERGRSSLDQATRVQAYRTLQRLATQDVPVLYYVRRKQTQIADKDVRGLEMTNFLLMWDRVWLDA